MVQQVKALDEAFFALSRRLNEIYAEKFRMTMCCDEYVQQFKMRDGASVSFNKCPYREHGLDCLLKVTTINETTTSNAFQFGDNSCEMYELRGADPMEVRKHFGEIEDESLYPLKIVDVIAHKAEPRFWHYVSFGLSNLFDEGNCIVWKKRKTPVKAQSGNIELTLRVAMKSSLPPTWPLRALQMVAQDYFATGLEIGPGQYIELNDPVEADFNLAGFLVVRDALIGAVPCSQGVVQPFLLVGITDTEADWVKANTVQGVLDRLSPSNEMLLTQARFSVV